MREVLWIDSDEALERALHALEGPLGFDLEADSFHHFRSKICLIQLSSAAFDVLIDPLASVDLAPLGSVLRDPARLKVLHGGDYDVRMLRAGPGLGFEKLFDTMIAARLAGERALGLAALLESHLGIRLDKSHQKADWSERPLPAPLRAYASLDTRHLLELQALLSVKLTTLGRLPWAEEEFERLRQLEPWTLEPEPWRRIKGANRLDRRELAALRELSALRDEIASAKDLPRFRIARDEVMVEAARALLRPGSNPGEVPGLPASWSRGELPRRWVEAASRVLSLPREALPELLDRERPPRNPAREAGVRRLAGLRDRLARELDLEPSIVATRSQLEDVFDALERGSALAEVPSLRAWQRSLLAPLLDGQARASGVPRGGGDPGHG